MPRIAQLRTPPLPCLVPAHVFDAFAWCASDVLEWRRPLGVWDDASPIDGADPARMVFVLHRPCAFLPTEAAALHAFGLGLGPVDQALAPWAIDDATDGLYEHRLRPRDVLWLAADNLNALYWGLHDWAHFHNHGPFEERAWTELQCDVAALLWLWLNRDAIGLSEGTWESARTAAVALSRERFGGDEGAGGGGVASGGTASDSYERLLAPGQLRGLAAELASR